jgi:hypothetical protein
MAGFRGGKEAVYFDHLPAALLHLGIQEVQEFAE